MAEVRITASGCDRPVLRDLVNHVISSVANHWYDLGLQLLDPKYENELDIIEAADMKNDTKTCCRKMFSKWLTTDELASWDKVIEALTLIGLNSVASNIKQLLGQGITDDIQPICPTLGWDDDKQSKKKLSNFDEMEVEFGNMVVDIKKALDSNNIKVNDLLLKLRSSSAVRDRDVPLFGVDVFVKVKSIDKLFEILSGYWHLYDYDVLIYLVDTAQCEAAKKRYIEFLDGIDSSVIRNCQLILKCRIFKDENLLPGTCRLRIKLSRDKCTLETEKEVKTIIAKHFKLENYALLFKGIKEGCVEVFYQISSSVKDYILQCKVTSLDMKMFGAHKISVIKIDDDAELRVVNTSNQNDVFAWSYGSNLNSASWVHSLQDNIKEWYQSLKNDRSILDEIIWSPFPFYPCIGYQCVFHDSLQSLQSTNRAYSSCLGTLQNLQDIFEPLNTSVPEESNPDTYGLRSILVEGHSGVGKTTLCMEICVQWVEGHLFTPDELVLLLLLHDPSVHKITSDLQLAEYFTTSAILQREFVEYLGQYEGAGVAIVIDGYDLLSSELQESCYLRGLIERRKLPKARIIFTSKPFASNDFHSIVDRRIEIFELEASHKNEFIATALKDHPSTYETLQKHFHQYPNMDRLSHMPRYMAIIVLLCLQYPDSLPMTAADMFNHFLFHVIKYQLTVTEAVDEFGDLSHSVLKELEQFAFATVRDSKEVFFESELPYICRDHSSCYNLVYYMKSCNEVEQLIVLDQDLLVYLAARHVAGMPSKEMADLFRIFLPVLLGVYHMSIPVGSSFKFHKMWSLVFEMTLGLSGVFYFAEPSFAIADTDSTLPKFISHLYTLSPSGHSQQFNVNKVHARRFTPPVLYQTSEVAVVKLLKKVMEEPYEGILCLLKCFQGVHEFDEIVSHTFVKGVIDFSNKHLLSYHVESLALLLKSLKTARVLLLPGCHIGDYGMFLLHQNLSTSDVRLNTVDLCGNNLTAASSSLITNLINCLNPHSLVLSFNNISDAGIKDIGATIVENKYSKVLNISGNRITIKGTQAISEMIVSLEELDISNSNIGDDGASVLSKALSRTTTLKSLAIKQCNISEAGTSAIATALTYNSSLTVLLMNGNAIGSYGVSELSLALCSNSTLKELSLTGDQTIDYAAASELLLVVLCVNSTLTDLDLPEEINNRELLHKNAETFINRTKPLNLYFW